LKENTGNIRSELQQEIEENYTYYVNYFSKVFKDRTKAIDAINDTYVNSINNKTKIDNKLKYTKYVIRQQHYSHNDNKSRKLRQNNIFIRSLDTNKELNEYELTVNKDMGVMTKSITKWLDSLGKKTKPLVYSYLFEEKDIIDIAKERKLNYQTVKTLIRLALIKGKQYFI